jgi:hypothetical protein
MVNAGSSAKKLDDEINYVKEELHGIGVQKKKLVIRLGEAFEGVIKSESICKEIKKVLKDEIEKELISHRLIEQYCLPKWKKETRPKRKKNEETSFSAKPEMPILVDTKGNENPIPASDDNPPSSSEGSDLKSENNEINLSKTESPDCKVLIQKIHDLEDTIRELEEELNWPREFELSIPFRELKIQLIRQSNISGQGEPVLIYLTIDLTSNKVSYTLGKKPEQN